jgi:Fic family protein
MKIGYLSKTVQEANETKLEKAEKTVYKLLEKNSGRLETFKIKKELIKVLGVEKNTASYYLNMVLTSNSVSKQKIFGESYIVLLVD